MPSRKSTLGKRKNIARPIPIQPPISTIKHRLGTGKETAHCASIEQRNGVLIISVSKILHLKI